MSTPESSLFTRVLVRPVAADDALHGVLFHLWWSAPEQGSRVVQVYANGRLHEAVTDPAERERWLLFPAGRSVRIELRAVPIAEAWVPRVLDTTDATPRDTAEVTLLRDPSVPVGAVVSVAVDDAPAEQALLFGPRDARIGFGAVFGFGGFGYDAVTGPGLGRGALGLGPLGADGEPWRWRRDDLPAGAHGLTLSLANSEGQPLAQAEPVDIEIETLPPPPMHLFIDDDLTLSWT